MRSFFALLAVAMASAFMTDSSVRSPATGGKCTLIPIPLSALHHAIGGAPRIRNKDGTSKNWSGYAVQTNLKSPLPDSVSNVKGTWSVPAVTTDSPATTYSSIWIGIDGYSDSTVEQLGTEQDWTSSGPVYYAWVEMYPKAAYLIHGFPVVAGDEISAEVRYVGNGQFTLSMNNITSGASYSTTLRAKNAKRQSAEWIVEAPSSKGVLPLADLGTVSFTNCSATVNGHTGSVSNSAWQKDAITMTTANGVVKARPSALSPDGSSFSVTWYHE